MNHKPIIFSILVFFSLACQEKNTRISVLNFDPHLKKTDEGWLYNDQPFTGYMIEEEKDHRIVYRLPIIDGKAQGLAKGWYYTSEKLLERKFIDGKIEGEFKQWWPNGAVRYLFYYKNDKFDGKQKVYFPNGKVREESNYILGEKEGLQRTWDEKGFLISNYAVKNKRIYGVASVKSCIPVGH